MLFKRLTIILLLISVFIIPVSADDFYAAHYVTLHFVYYNSTPIAGNVSITSYGLSYGNQDSEMVWLYNMFGIEYNNTPIDNTSTFTNGTLVVPMYQMYMYNVSMSNDSIGEHYHYLVYPVENDYWFIGH